MKKFNFIAVVFTAVLLMAGSSFALTLDYFTGNAAHAIYNDTGAEYVTLTDPVDPASAPMIQLNTTILDVYAQDYIVGIFDFDTRTTLDVLDTFEDRTISNVVFNIADGTATTKQGSLEIDTAAIGSQFGFFLRFYSDDVNGILTNEMYWSDDTDDVFSIFYDPNGIIIPPSSISELALGIGGPGTQGHALISVEDVEPVPEPGTLVLLGFGLMGVSAYIRKKKA